jgi:hypothetical protein
MTTHPSDLIAFRDQLGRELVAAARRRQGYGRVSGGRWPAIAAAGVVATAALVVTVVLVGGLVRTDPVSADVLAIGVVDTEVQIEVVSIVQDPDRVEAQLWSELGLDAELVAVPVPPELEGSIVAISSEGTVTPELVVGDDRAVDRAVLPRGFTGFLIVEFGRRAEPGEAYEATTTDPICRELWGRSSDQVAATIAASSSSVRYETLDLANNITVDASPGEIPDDFKVVDVVYLSEDQLLVTLAADLDSIPRHSNCR